MLGTLIVSLSLMTVCLPDTRCFPVLIGDNTPQVGTYPIKHARTLAPGYGADGQVLVFATRRDGVPLAFHRVYRMDPQRIARLAGPAAARKGITGGCINAMPQVFQAAVDCCSRGHIQIVR